MATARDNGDFAPELVLVAIGAGGLSCCSIR
jgi:hypothetical protein